MTPMRSGPLLRAAAIAGAALLLLAGTPAYAQDPPPALTATVNDFAGLIDADSARQLDTLIRALQRASGDVLIVATVDTIAPYADAREYAVKMFENRGSGIGQGGKDNGLLVLVARQEREVRIEVGYDLEGFVTDGFAGETVRQYIAPDFRRGDYGPGLVRGVSRLVARVAEGRNVVLQGVPREASRRDSGGASRNLTVAIIVLFLILNAIGRTRRRRSGRWGRGPWSGWHSGVGPFGGPFGGG
ncbi:MAG: TPM domain-containing protein, partial [Vicinamibacterales bacterium]